MDDQVLANILTNTSINHVNSKFKDQYNSNSNHKCITVPIPDPAKPRKVRENPRKIGKEISCSKWGGGERIQTFGQNIYPWCQINLLTAQLQLKKCNSAHSLLLNIVATQMWRQWWLNEDDLVEVSKCDNCCTSPPLLGSLSLLS